MSQTYLTENPPMILDATCSFTHIWPAHATLRMDNRAMLLFTKKRPDIIADAGFLPFRNGIFDEIYCDPPHMVRKSPWHGTTYREMITTFRPRYTRFRQHLGFDMGIRYGWWESREEWLNFIDKSGREFKRTLKLNGVLYYKITDEPNKKVSKHDLQVMPFEITETKTTRSKSHLANKNQVHWLTMKPRQS